MQTTINLFQKRQYISLETYRKSGESVRTPVWFAQDGNTLFVWTDGDSGKSKRIRRSPQVKVAPSDQVGKPLDEYVNAVASVHQPGSPLYQHGHALIDKKYGLMKKLFELMGRARNSSRVIIEIRLGEGTA